MPVSGARHDPVRVVIAGGGVAALETLMALRAMAPRRLDAVVVSISDHFSYRPLQVGEPFGLGRGSRYPLRALCGELGAVFVHDGIASVQAGAHTITTTANSTIEYDILVLAIGARAFPAFDHGATFDRETAPEAFDEVLAAARGGLPQGLAVVVPDGATWSLAAYELALLTAAHSPGTGVTLVTHESAPLAAFGSVASGAVAEILDEARVTLRTNEQAAVATAAALRVGREWLEVSRIVSLPLLAGTGPAGVPCDEHGFVHVDGYGRVDGLEDVYAAGDGTTLPIKQGGLAAQQADAVAAHIAAELGGDVKAAPLRGVLRGLLLTSGGPRYLRAELDDPQRTSAISEEPLWWPPSKIASRWLAPHLARVDAERSAGVVPAAG